MAAARAAAVVALIGAVVSPPLATVASAVFVAAFFLLPDWRARLRAATLTPLGWGVMALLAALLLGAVFGAFGPQGARVAFAELLGWRTLPLLLLAAAVFDDDRARVRAMATFAVFAAAAALATTTTVAIGWGHHHMAPGVLLRNTATQAIAFALGAYFCLLLLALRRRALARWQAAALLAMLGLLLWRLFFHEIGRSGHLLFFVLLLASGLAALRGRLRVAAAVVVPLAAAVLLALSPVVRARFALAVHEMASVEQSREGTSMGGRVVMWRNGLALALERPLLGYGLAGVLPAYQARVQRTEAGWRAEPTTDVHNQYLMLWLEAGLAGPLAFLAFLVGAVRQPTPMPWRAIGLSILAGWCVNSLFSSHFGTFNEGHLIALLIGMFLAVGPARPPVAQDTGPALLSVR